MKILGKKQHPILGEIDDVKMEESDFDFSKNWDEISLNIKADFLSFLEVGFLNSSNEPQMKSMWEYYQLKHNAEY